MSAARNLVARRAIQSLRIWPGDTVLVRDDGSVELRRILPPGAALSIHCLESRGDLRAADEITTLPANLGSPLQQE